MRNIGLEFHGAIPGNQLGLRNLIKPDAQRIAGALTKLLGFEVFAVQGLGEWQLSTADCNLPNHPVLMDNFNHLVGTFVAGYRQALRDLRDL